MATSVPLNLTGINVYGEACLTALRTKAHDGSSNVAIYPGDVIYNTTAGFRLLNDSTAANQADIVGVAMSYLAAGETACIDIALASDNEFWAQCVQPQSTVAFVLADDIGYGISLALDHATYPPDTTAYRAKGGIAAKLDSSSACAIITGAFEKPGYYEKVIAAALDTTDYPYLRFRFLNAKCWPEARKA